MSRSLTQLTERLRSTLRSNLDVHVHRSEPRPRKIPASSGRPVAPGTAGQEPSAGQEFARRLRQALEV